MVPSAWRIRESTMAILVKEVSITRMAGASDSTVNSKNICSTTEISWGACILSRRILMVAGDSSPSWARAAPESPGGIDDRHQQEDGYDGAMQFQFRVTCDVGALWLTSSLTGLFQQPG